jgi:pantoate--beta-alanine ligase
MIQVFEKIAPLRTSLEDVAQNGRTVGFVPTMGSLHAGHTSLIRESKKDNDITVCSVFVNPTQFNNRDDLKNYPRDFDADLAMLEKEKCDVVFHPAVEEMYPEPPSEKFDFGQLEKVMEGAFRPGHFNGVATVVKRLFEIVKPNRAYFGLKDYQQLVIIHKMTMDLGLPVEIVPCAIIREKGGLAMSSRNQLLSESEKKQARLLHKTLKFVKVRAGFATILEIKEYVEKQFRKQKNMKLEYFEIVDMYSLKPLRSWAESNNAIACIAVWVGKVRLIDNIILFS